MYCMAVETDRTRQQDVRVRLWPGLKKDKKRCGLFHRIHIRTTANENQGVNS